MENLLGPRIYLYAYLDSNPADLFVLGAYVLEPFCDSGGFRAGSPSALR
jgi:hypothetical protein